MGLGDDYNEDLLAMMANRGDGNFFHIESPQQLPDFFASELQGLMATLGRQVSLGIRPKNDCQLDQLLNDLSQTPAGNWMLPNLMSGSPIEVVFQLQVPPQATQSSLSDVLCSVRLAWDSPDSARRQSFYRTIQLPVMLGLALDELPLHKAVEEQVRILQAARARVVAIAALDQGNVAAASQTLTQVCEALKTAPATPALQAELAQLDDLQRQLAVGNLKSMRKQARYQEYNAARSRQRKG